MSNIWVHPWNLSDEGLSTSLTRLSEMGLSKIVVASHYHSVRLFQPRTLNSPFKEYPGGCYFTPTTDHFQDLPIQPPVNEVDGLDDPLETVVAAANDHNLDTAGWVVCLHNSRLGAMNPSYRIQSAFGTPHDHSLCPSRPIVQEYFARILEETIERGVTEIHLESIGFPGVFHGHATSFGHDKQHAITTESGRWLLSQCFCSGCRAEADKLGIDIKRARETVQQLLQQALKSPESQIPGIPELLFEHEVLEELLTFRMHVIDSFLEELADRSENVDLSMYVLSAENNWSNGIRLNSLQEHLDRITCLCYVNDPELAGERVRVLTENVDVPVDASVTMNPEQVPTVAAFEALVDGIRAELEGEIGFYHYGLCTPAHLEWIERAIADSDV